MTAENNAPTHLAQPRICVVTAGGAIASIIVNLLGDAYGPIDVIREQPETREELLRKRIRKFGRIRVAAQSATMFMVRWAKRLNARAMKQKLAEAGLRSSIDSMHRVHEIDDVNGGAFLEALERINPQIILLCGCRMVKASVLARVTVPILNYHAGITPAYRGMNGGYWALAMGDRENFGATIHLVDAGVDTGMIVAQVRGRPSPGDGIWSHAYTQVQMSRDMCVRAIGDVLSGDYEPRVPMGRSMQWYDPEIWTYLRIALTKRVF
jgi:methionyl-tRNA formyltransferase